MTKPSILVRGWIAIWFAAPLLVHAAQQRHIEAVTPRGGQTGTTVEVTIMGKYIQDPKEILFYRPGIRAVEIQTAPDLQYPINRAHGGQLIECVKAKFVIAPDCPVGEHPFKLRTATQLSTLSTFWVTPFPIHPEQEPEKKYGANDSLGSAEVLTEPAMTVRGSMGSVQQADLDCYRIVRKKGERISVEVDSVRLSDLHYGESEFDLAVRVLDNTGKEIANNDDSDLHVQDPILSVLAPADGEYIVEVRQSVYGSASMNYYLAHIGTNERPLAVYPAGGESGKPLEVTFLGDAVSAGKRKIELPKQTGDFAWIKDQPSPLPMRVSAYPNALESDTPKPMALPIALNGIIEKPTDSDEFTLQAKKGQPYRVRVFARSLGTPLDPRFEILDPETGKAEATGDDGQHLERDFWGVAQGFQLPDLLDPSIVWTPSRDGEFTLKISDMRGLGGPRYVYRVEIEPTSNSLHTFMYARVIDSAECSKFTAFTIPAENRWTTNVRLAEGQGNSWKGDAKLVAKGLPEGVEMVAPVVRAGQKEAPVQFIAKPGTKPQLALIRLEAQPVEPGVQLASLSQQAMPFLSHSGGRPWHAVIVDQYALAVTEPAPFSLEVESPQVPLSQNGELALKVTVKRAPGFDETVEINSYWAPDGVSPDPGLQIPPGQSEGIFHFAASGGAKPGDFQVALQATTLSGVYFSGVGDIRVSSPFINLKVAEPYIALKSDPASIRRGQKAEFIFKVEHKKPFQGDAEVLLNGLPKGITVVEPAPKLKAGQPEIIFTLEASQEALLGQYKQIGCELLIAEGDQTIRQRMGSGILRVDPALNSQN